MEARKTWLDSINQLAGIGPKTSLRFQQLGIFTIKDLLFHFPFRYEDIQARDIETILDGEKVTLLGRVLTQPTVSYFGRKKSRLQFKFQIGLDSVVQVVFFNQPYLAKSIIVGEERAIFGKWVETKQQLLGMKVIPKSKESDDFQGVYSLTQGLRQNQVLKAIEEAFRAYGHLIPEILPQRINDKYHLQSLNQALYNMHFPKVAEDRRQGQRKIIYQEFFLYQWRLQEASKLNRQRDGLEIHYDVNELKKVINQLPFELTKGQKMAVNEICYDLLAPYPMQRMLQGEVGSGKTLVAFIAMIAAVQAGYQTALMVPTEILAKQHYDGFNALFEAMDLHAEILVSAMAKKDKEAVISGLTSGRIRIVIGTHALIQDNIYFKNLGLVIIDEQHRFGVRQRQVLLEKGQSNLSVNLLQMTATPIPRTLALSLYGEMSVSTIQELPKGRKPIQTHHLKSKDLDQVYQALDQELKLGHQAYYVLPLIDESDELDQVESVQSIYQALQAKFPLYRMATLHGRLDKEEQRDVMNLFIHQEIDILIATTMVEVGVNVPNATLMIIQDADRFGLAQLHQLRGRVGRGSAQSYCYLIADPSTEQGQERMKIMVSSQDGFYISQEDLKLRGMGDILGRSQSGLPNFHYANIIENQEILHLARLDVEEILKQPYLISEEEIKILQAYNREVMIEF